MKSERNNLKIFCYLFFVLAAIQAVELILMFADGGFAQAMAQAAPGFEAATRIIFIVMIVIAVIEILVLVYLGVMGLREAKGEEVGSSHIVIAKIGLVVLIIGLIATVISFFTGDTKDWVEICTALGNVFIVSYYISMAKALKNSDS